MVAHGEGVGGCPATLPGDFRQRRSLVKGIVAEARIDVIADQGQMRHLAAVVAQEVVYDSGLLVATGDQAKGRINILVDGGGKAGLDPLAQAGDIGAHAPE